MPQIPHLLLAIIIFGAALYLAVRIIDWHNPHNRFFTALWIAAPIQLVTWGMVGAGGPDSSAGLFVGGLGLFVVLLITILLFVLLRRHYRLGIIKSVLAMVLLQVCHRGISFAVAYGVRAVFDTVWTIQG